MNIHLTETMIRERASAQSFQRGREYYEIEAIFNPTKQPTPEGVVLMSYCSGSSEDDYRLRVELGANEVNAATCTCPYDWGGYCKHIVALLLTYLHQPEDFEEQKSIPELLAGLGKEQLAALVERLVQGNPDLYDQLDSAITAAKRIQVPEPENGAWTNQAVIYLEPADGQVASKPATPKVKLPTQVAEASYRKQIKRILKQSRHSDHWGELPGYLDDLEEIRQEALELQKNGDDAGALIILRLLLEMTLEDYDEEMDYEGDYGAFIQKLSMPLAEAILSVDLDPGAFQELRSTLEDLLEDANDYMETDSDVLLAALKYGWGDLPTEAWQASQTSEPGEDEAYDDDEYDEDDDDEYDEDDDDEYDEDEDDEIALRELIEARLNVLERQGRIDEFLQTAAQGNPYRHTMKLIEMGQIEAAIEASQSIDNTGDILSVAKKFSGLGRLEAGIVLAEHALEQYGSYASSIAAWLAPLEEARGNIGFALQAYQAAFEGNPSIEFYRKVKRLSEGKWSALRPQILEKVTVEKHPNIWIDIYLEEDEWDAAIALAKKDSWVDSVYRVAAAVTNHRPDWVIQTARKKAEALIAPTQSKLYPEAAKWLGLVKEAYLHKGQAAEWENYISNLRQTYIRRPAFMKAIDGL